ncbi:MAG: hypothetical protein FD136_662 [Chitinophagaceae bacterium]|nr:MAG: hypothetical protein FD136_662 [Chitinophagaceae bacterium]
MKTLITKIIFRKSIILFVIGITLSTTFHFKSESLYIVDKRKEDAGPTQSIDSFFVAAMRMTHTLEFNRQKIFGGKKLAGLKADFFRPATIDLMTGDGACGSNSTVLARILKAGGYQVRIAHMSVENLAAGHMVVEAKKRSNWIVLDPLLQQYFKKPDGGLASFKDVQTNWAYYQQQTSPSYVPAYKYESVRYTNWNKIPLLGNFIQSSLGIVIGKEQTNDIAIRSYILRKYHFLYLFSLTVFIFSCCWLLVAIQIKRKQKINAV